MFEVVLYQPEIPPNTGNIMRLCANTDTRLHLIQPLGFDLEDRMLRRAGLDYREWADVSVHTSFDAYVGDRTGARLFAFTRDAEKHYADVDFQPTDALLFGPESDGLPDAIKQREEIAEMLRIPMVRDSRSLNLSNAVSIVLYEALRQHRFPGLV